MKAQLLYLLLLFFSVCSTPAYAFWGVGDVTFDPTTYGEVMNLYNQTVKLWNTAKESLNTLNQVQQTLNQAKEGVDALKNFNLKQTAGNLVAGGNGGSDKINALRAEMSNVEGGISGSTSYISYQTQRITNLQNLEKLRKESAKNLSKASDTTSSDANGKITAQSTSTMAALAAAEEQRKEEQDMATARDAEQRRSLIGESSKIYDTMGKD
jgi:hypothetical protein